MASFDNQVRNGARNLKRFFTKTATRKIVIACKKDVTESFRFACSANEIVIIEGLDEENLDS
ncbi:hypothetical protein Ccrd_001247 [Cynara cardunculus var. scolymus]|uniref:Uncharacterized protein n=1 Tax=Cynara cardunculus var. scolymus TaxID=59895 RepID=A0A103XTP5_CYNCS|nr:hypothetical protein Ccrd_001247 [Cynara cardunculus var. scolymus]